MWGSLGYPEILKGQILKLPKHHYSTQSGGGTEIAGLLASRTDSRRQIQGIEGVDKDKIVQGEILFQTLSSRI